MKFYSDYSEANEVLTLVEQPSVNNPSSVTATSFVANWDEIVGATYTLFVRDNLNTLIQTITDIETNSQLVEDLDADTQYKYSVQSFIGENESEVSGNTDLFYTLPATPTANDATDIESDGFTSNYSSGANRLYLYKDSVLESGYPITVGGTSQVISGLLSEEEYSYKVSTVSHSQESLLSNEEFATTISAFPNFDDSYSYSIHYDSNSMIGSGTALIDNSGNGNDGMITDPSWVSDSKWGYGLSMNGLTRKITIPSDASFKSSGANAILFYAEVLRLNSSLANSTFYDIASIYNTTTSEWALYLGTANDYTTTKEVFLYLELLDNSGGVAPTILALYSNNFVINEDEDIGISFIADLSNSNIKFIFNQSTLSTNIDALGGYYTSIADFKTAGGINSSSNDLTIGNSSLTGPNNFDRTIWRVITKAGSTITEAQIKQEFYNMDLFSPLEFSSSIDWDLLYNGIQMVGSGTTIDDGSVNSNIGTLVGATWVNDPTWGNGLNFNSANRRVEVPHNATYKSIGTTARLFCATTFRLEGNTGLSRIFTIYSNPNSQFSFHFYKIGSITRAEIQFVKNSSSNPYLLILSVDLPLLLTNIDYGIAFIGDLVSEEFKVILNQTTYDCVVNTNGGASYAFSSIADFKTAGGIQNVTQQALLGNGDTTNLATQFFEGTIWRHGIVADSIYTTAELETKIKEEFLNMGLVAIYEQFPDSLYFDFREGSGTTIMSSTKGSYIGTLSGGTTFDSAFTNLINSVASANLNGSGRKITVPYSANYRSNGANAKYTIFAIFNIASFASDSHILAAYDDLGTINGINETELAMQVSTTGQMRLVLFNTSVSTDPNYNLDLITTDASISTGIEYGFGISIDLQNDTKAAVQGQTSLTFDVNGISSSPSVAAFGGIQTTTRDLWVGNIFGYETTNYFKGKLGLIWVIPDIAMTDVEMKAILAELGFSYSTNGLKAFYKFNNNSDDTSINNNDALLVGGASVLSNYLVLGDNDDDAFFIPFGVIDTLTDFTISAWLKLDTLHDDTANDVNMFINGVRNDAASNVVSRNAFEIDYYYTTSKWRIIQNNVVYDFAINTTIEDLAVHHFAFTRSGTTAKLYIDNVLIDTISITNSAIDIDAGGLCLGQHQHAIGSGFMQYESWAGKMDNCFIYDRALSALEINDLYNVPHDL